MEVGKRLLSILIILIGSFSMTYGQSGKPMKSIISIENQYLIVGVDNPIRIVAQQKEPVAISQLSANFQVYDSKKVPIEIVEGKGYFIIRPDTIGWVEINITIGDTIETKTLRVKPIEAVGRLSKYGANTDEKIGIGEFEAQMGIIASVECCGFDAKCNVLGFQTIRINNRNQVERRINKGGRFEEATREIIMKAESGDIYIFRQIKYKCPGSEKPQRLDDMIFEIE
ncbi:MAG: GldM family protein [Saprospiraceae bacterium]